MPYFLEKNNSNKELAKEHVLVGEIRDLSKRGSVLTFFIKSMLIFVAAYSTIMGLLTAFNVPCIKPVIISFFVVFSIIASFLYIKKIIFYIGYIVIFLAFTIELSRYFYYANSGFQGVVNIIYEAYSDYYALSSLRQAQELYNDRTVTVTFAAIFIGLFLIILLNITISGYMNFFETFIITFPFLEIGFYIGKKPPIIYVFGLLFVYTTVFLLQANKYSRTQVKGKHTHEFARIKRNNRQYFFYQTDLRIFIIALVLSFLITSLSVFVSSGVYYKETSRKPQNEIHRQIDEYVKIFIQTGITGFINSYSSKGGLSGGKLGGVSQIRPDFETDLTVTFTPINYDSLYLKGFTGSTYFGSQWMDSVIYEENGQKSGISYEEIDKFESSRVPIFENRGKISVTNVDANPLFIYTPYYTYLETPENENSAYNYKNVSARDSYEIYYYPDTNPNDYKLTLKDELLEDDGYNYYVNQYCTKVPDELKKVLDSTLSEIDFDESLTDNEYRLSVARKIYSYYVQNFDYTMSPGSTPKSKDFVDYFLTSQKRGFCAHFASAMTLLLREKGIPARYCEGYSIPMSLIYEDGILEDYDFDEWYQGQSSLDENTVITVDVNDSYAHAWVEIYFEGYGFVPFEATIPSFEETENNFNFSDLFSSLLSNTLNIDATIDDNEDINTGTNIEEYDFFKSFATINTNSAGTIAVVVFSIFIAIIVLILLAKWITIRLKLRIYKIKHDEFHLVMYDYQKLIKKLRWRQYIHKKNPLMSDVKKAYEEYLINYNTAHKKKDIDIDKIFEYYERILYS